MPSPTAKALRPPASPNPPPEKTTMKKYLMTAAALALLTTTASASELITFYKGTYWQTWGSSRPTSRQQDVRHAH